MAVRRRFFIVVLILAVLLVMVGCMGEPEEPQVRLSDDEAAIEDAQRAKQADNSELLEDRMYEEQVRLRSITWDICKLERIIRLEEQGSPDQQQAIERLDLAKHAYDRAAAHYELNWLNGFSPEKANDLNISIEAPTLEKMRIELHC